MPRATELEYQVTLSGKAHQLDFADPIPDALTNIRFVDALAVSLTINHSGQTSRKMTLPTSAVFLEDQYHGLEGTDWFVTKGIDRTLLEERLMGAYFSPSDSFGEADSYDTQRDSFQEEVSRLVGDLLLSKRDAILEALTDSLRDAKYVAFGHNLLEFTVKFDPKNSELKVVSLIAKGGKQLVKGKKPASTKKPASKKKATANRSKK